MESDRDVRSQADQALDFFNAGDYRRARALIAKVLSRYGDSSLATESQFLKARLRLDVLEVIVAVVGLLALIVVYFS